MRIRPWRLGALLLALLAGTSPLAFAEDEEPADEPKPEGGEDGGEGGGADGGDQGGAEGGGDAAEPAAGGGLTKDFPDLNLSWTLPPPPKEEGPGWLWGTGGNPNLQKKESGRVAEAALVKDGENVIVVLLHVQPATPGATVERFLDTQSNIDDMNKQFESNAMPKIERSLKVGNVKGGALVMTGKAAGKTLQLRKYFVVLKKVVYIVVVEAWDGAQNAHTKELMAALAGLKWKDTDMGIRGPIQAPWIDDTEPRGKEGPDEKLDRGPLKVKRPAAFRELERSGGNFQNWVFGAEARKGGAYAFVGVQRLRLPKSQNEPGVKPPEEIVDELEGNWRNAVEDPVTRPKSEKSNKSPSSFKGGKGFEYEFRGTFHENPFLERGYVVKDAGAVWVVRVQYGGKGAEQALQGDVKALVNSIAFEK